MNMIDILKNKKVLICLIVIFVIGIVMIMFYNERENSEDSIEYNLESIINEGNNDENINSNNSSNSSNIEDENSNNKEQKSTELYIHIIGEVQNSGIIVLNEGDRIIDAINKAGGATEYADLSKVNLAYKLSDGQKVKIPNVNDKNEGESYVYSSNGEGVISGGENEKNEKVNINTATQTELETLTGIGPSLAAEIIKYRNQIGKFKNVEELKNVSGIGESKFKQVKDEVVIK